MLLPGDKVFIPEKRQKKVIISTGQIHKFIRKGDTVLFSLTLFDADGEPLADRPYILNVDGVETCGQTDSKGQIRERIYVLASRGKLTLTKTGDEYELKFGHLDPVDSITGVQARLNNLGFACGAVDGDAGPKTRECLYAFKEDVFKGDTKSDKDAQQILGENDPWHI